MSPLPLTISTPPADARDVLTHEEAVARAAAVNSVSYALRLDFNAGSDRFRGRIAIRFNLAAAVSGPIFLCFRGETIRAMRLNGAAVANPQWNGYRLTLARDQLKPGAENLLEVEYENLFDTGAMASSASLTLKTVPSTSTPTLSRTRHTAWRRSSISQTSRRA